MPLGPCSVIGDTHACPVSDGPKPHVGGAISGPPLVPNVLVGGRPIVVEGTPAVCVGPPNAVAEGSKTVKAGGMGVARFGDSMAHGGKITGPGVLNVIVGG